MLIRTITIFVCVVSLGCGSKPEPPPATIRPDGTIETKDTRAAMSTFLAEYHRLALAGEDRQTDLANLNKQYTDFLPIVEADSEYDRERLVSEIELVRMMEKLCRANHLYDESPEKTVAYVYEQVLEDMKASLIDYDLSDLIELARLRVIRLRKLRSLR